MNARLPSFSNILLNNSNSNSRSQQSLNGQPMTDNYGAIEAPPPNSRSSSSQDLYNDNDSILDDEGQEFDQLIRTYERSWKRDLEEVTAETNAKVAELIRAYERPSSSLWSTFLNGMLVLGVGVVIFFAAVSTRNYTLGNNTTDETLQPKEIIGDLSSVPSRSPTVSTPPISSSIITPSCFPTKLAPSISVKPSHAPVTYYPTKETLPASMYDGGVLTEGRSYLITHNKPSEHPFPTPAHPKYNLPTLFPFKYVLLRHPLNIPSQHPFSTPPPPVRTIYRYPPLPRSIRSHGDERIFLLWENHVPLPVLGGSTVDGTSPTIDRYIYLLTLHIYPLTLHSYPLTYPLALPNLSHTPSHLTTHTPSLIPSYIPSDPSSHPSSHLPFHFPSHTILPYTLRCILYHTLSHILSYLPQTPFHFIFPATNLQSLCLEHLVVHYSGRLSPTTPRWTPR